MGTTLMGTSRLVPLLSLLIRSGVILLAAEVLRRALRGSPAARRHNVVLFAVALLIDWPLLASLIPAIPVSWPAWFAPIRHAQGGVETSQTFRAIAGNESAHFNVYWPVIVWALGALITAAPFVIGALRLRRMVRSAKPVYDDALRRLVSDLSSELHIAKVPETLLLAGPAMPMTFGLLRPRVLLPDAALTWTQSRLRAVLLHELAHVKRRDLASQFLAQLATTLWWFQPISWISRSSLRRESERACDELVLRQGVPASEYAAELLEIARSFGATGHCAAAIPMATEANCGDLEDRLQNILTRARKKTGWFRFSVALSCLLLLTMASSAVTFTQQNPMKQQRSSTMTLSSLRRTVLSGLLVSAGLSAASIGGSILDPKGSPVADAKASIYNPATSMKKEVATSADGKFAFESLDAGAYILRIEKPGFPTLFREFKVLDNSSVDQGLVFGDNSKQTDNKQAEGDQPKQLRVKGEVQQANLIYKLTPVYPASAKKDHIQGQVVLEAVISNEGTVQELHVISSPSDDLSQSALQAVAQWRYRPTLLNGDPISVVTDIIVNYTLSQ
jgi:TonB family protein